MNPIFSVRYKTNHKYTSHPPYFPPHMLCTNLFESSKRVSHLCSFSEREEVRRGRRKKGQVSRAFNLMGNCMERSSDEIQWREEEEEEEEEVKQQNKQVEEEEEDGEGKKRVRVKIVLTKEELQWLILQLNQKQGMGLDQVLEEIQRNRDRVEAWKPSLESIMEIPEVPEMDR